MRRWVASFNSDIMKNVFRKRIIITEDDVGTALSYRLCEGQTVSLYKLKDEELSSCQKRLLLFVANKYDIVYNRDSVCYVQKIRSVVDHPEARVLLPQAPNMYFYTKHNTQEWKLESKERPLVAKSVADTLWKYDQAFFSAYRLYLPKKDVLVPRDFLVENNVRSPTYEEFGITYYLVEPLWLRVARLLSSYYCAYSGHEYPFVHNAAYAIDNVLPSVIRQLPKWNILPCDKYDFDWTFRAIVFYYTHCVSLKRHDWEYNPTDVKHLKFSNSSFGYYQPDRRDMSVEIGGAEIRFCSKGKKNSACTMLLKRLYDFLDTAYKNVAEEVPIEKKIFVGYTNLAIKDQHTSKTDDGDYTVQANIDQQQGARLFTLYPDFMFNFFKFRHFSERTYYRAGHYSVIRIEIGTKWIWGGAELKARILRVELMDQYKPIYTYSEEVTTERGLEFKFFESEERREEHCPTVRWEKISEGTQVVSEGDIKKLDQNIKAIMLVMYMLCAQIWINKRDTRMFRMFQYLLESCAENLAGKHVRWFNSFCLIVGMMPSGSLETSHGDSWVMAVYYFLTFFFYKLSYCPEDEKARFFKYVSLRRIIILLFGDDFLYSLPRELVPIFGIQEFEKFLLEFFHTEMKYCKTFGTVITHLRLLNGFVVQDKLSSEFEITKLKGDKWKVEDISILGGHRGPTYLKRRIIDVRNFNIDLIVGKDCPAYVSWRDVRQYFRRAGNPNNPEKGDLGHNLTRIIGLLYDTMGIDPIAYQFLSMIYDITIDKILDQVKNRAEFILMMKKNEEVLDKYVKKIGLMKLHNMQKPSRNLLLSLNRRSLVEHDHPHPHSNWQTCVEFEENLWEEI